MPERVQRKLDQALPVLAGKCWTLKQDNEMDQRGSYTTGGGLERGTKR